MNYRMYRQDKEITAAAAVQKIKGEEVPEGYVLEVTHMSIADLSLENQLLELGYEDAAGEDRILTGNVGTNRFEWHLTGHAWIEGGETPFGRVTTPQSGNKVIFSCHGKLWPKS